MFSVRVVFSVNSSLYSIRIYESVYEKSVCGPGIPYVVGIKCPDKDSKN